MMKRRSLSRESDFDMWNSNRLCLLSCVYFSFVGMAGSALAQNEPIEDEAAAQEANFLASVAEGMDLYRAEKYPSAIAAFERAFAIKPKPNLQFNIGRSYERLGKLDEAIVAFEKFLSLPGTLSAARTKAANAISALKQEKAALSAATAADSLPPELPRATELPVERTEGSQVVAPAPAPSRALEIGLLATGGFLLAAGGVFGALALVEQSNFDDARDLASKTDAETAAERWALLADIGFVSGGAFAVAGLISWLVGGGSSSQEVALSPRLVEGGMGFAFSGAF